jgi:aspartyl-tRNA(Asn)/glutamyl-tRNA(Gln) amidotransferase subunit A
MNIPLTIIDAAEDLRAGRITCVELVTALLERIDRSDAQIGAVVGRNDAAALAAAATADRELADGTDRGPLHGVPIGVKDILASADMPTTGQSMAMLNGYQDIDSAVVAKLRDAGTIVIAKASCSEFACGTPDGSKPFTYPSNPWQPGRWSGGSSAGSASGVTAGYFLGSIGTDTGGSIRMPAAFCGITGLKPTAGLVSRFGCVPLSRSNDQIGPMARSAADCAALLTAMTGDQDPRDEATLGIDSHEDFSAALTGDLAGLTIGVDHETHRRAGVPPEMLRLFDQAVAELEALGARIVDFTVPMAEELCTAAKVVTSAEAFEVHRRNLQAHWADYGGPTRRSLTKGAFLSGSDYVRAKRILERGRDLMTDALSSVDCVATITLPWVSPLRGDEETMVSRTKAPLWMNLWNGIGMPAISAPIGLVPVDGTPEGLPIGMQLAGRAFSDGTLLRTADAFQRRTTWHTVSPTGFPT